KKGYHFPTGADYAAERLGYRREELAELPATVTPSFASLGNPLAMGLPLPRDTVVDIGAGRATRIPPPPPVTWAHGPRARRGHDARHACARPPARRAHGPSS